MLYLTRSPSQSVFISLADDVDPATPIGELFKDGPIRLRVMAIRGTQVRVRVQVPGQLEAHGEESMNWPHSVPAR